MEYHLLRNKYCNSLEASIATRDNPSRIDKFGSKISNEYANNSNTPHFQEKLLIYVFYRIRTSENEII